MEFTTEELRLIRSALSGRADKLQRLASQEIDSGDTTLHRALAPTAAMTDNLMQRIAVEIRRRHEDIEAALAPLVGAHAKVQEVSDHITSILRPPPPPHSECLWATGISVRYDSSSNALNGWEARLSWQDDRHAAPGAMRGTIRTAYSIQTLTEAIDYVLAVAQRFGIELLPVPGQKGPLLIYDAAGHSDSPPPEMWRETLAVEAEQRGWITE